MRRSASTDAAIRVLLCVDNFDIGGTQTQVVRLANALSTDSAVELHIACLRRRGPLLADLEVPRERVLEYPMRSFYGPRGLRQIVRFAAAAARADIDVIHAHDFYANVLCAAGAGWMRRQALVVSRRYERLSALRRHALGERLCYALADRVVFNSGLVADALVRDGVLAPAKVVVIPNGLDVKRFAAAREIRELSPDSPCRIGIVATLMDYKGHSVLLDAAALLRRTWKRLELRIVGDGALRSQIDRQVEGLGLGQWVRLVGAQRDVLPWLADLDLAVLSSLHTEGLPNSLLEYMAAGLPVVATRVGGIPEVVTDGREGLLVRPADPAALAQALDTLLRDRERRAAMSEAARVRAAAFDVPRMVAAMRQLYLDLARGTARQTHRPARQVHGEATHVRHLR